MKRCFGIVVSGLFLAGSIFTAHCMESSFQNLTIQVFGQLYPLLKQDVRSLEKRLTRLENQQKIAKKIQKGMLRDIKILYISNQLTTINSKELNRKIAASVERIDQKIERLKWDVFENISRIEGQLAELCLAQNFSGQRGNDEDSSSLFELSSTTVSSKGGPSGGYFVPEEFSPSNIPSEFYEELS